MINDLQTADCNFSDLWRCYLCLVTWSCTQHQRVPFSCCSTKKSTVLYWYCSTNAVLRQVCDFKLQLLLNVVTRPTFVLKIVHILDNIYINMENDGHFEVMTLMIVTFLLLFVTSLWLYFKNKQSLNKLTQIQANNNEIKNKHMWIANNVCIQCVKKRRS